MMLSQVICLRVGLFSTFFIVACKGKPFIETIWYTAVYQNPSKQYLDTLKISDFPRKRLFCFLEINRLDSSKYSSFYLQSSAKKQPIELVLVAKKSGLFLDENRDRYLVATRYFEDEALFESLVNRLSESYIILKTDSKPDTVYLKGERLERVNHLTIEYAENILSKRVETKTE
ncbi:hypothetical protein ACFSUS_27810 [Spirosoma soli]|uniref:Uncharacterized protein n=1 Tax=Spirosoma soli TaxID=1770529 RepID=A0ABW5MBL2_9BACT